MLIFMQKTLVFITYFFLKTFQRNSKLVLGNLDIPDHTPKMIVSFWGNIWHISPGKNRLHPRHFPYVIFLLQRYCTVDMPSYAHPKWYYQSVYLQVINQLHPPPISEDWLSAFWPIHRKQEFCAKYGISGEIPTIIAFILDHFRENLFKILINFWKKLNKIIFGSIWTLFAQIWSKMNFLGKEGSSSFWIFQLFAIMPKIKKN